MRQSEYTYTPDNLIISGQTGFQMIAISLATGKGKRGELMALTSIDASTLVATVSPINLTGAGVAREPYCLLANDIDASAAATRGVAFATGTFNSRAVILPDKVKISDVYLACRKVGLFLQDAMANPSA
ncbi:TPA: head decoration protein [Yersinia enterocolitica]|nr:head decoration protein [Yersinia enterocolitica]